MCVCVCVFGVQSTLSLHGPTDLACLGTWDFVVVVGAGEGCNNFVHRQTLESQAHLVAASKTRVREETRTVHHIHTYKIGTKQYQNKNKN